MATDRVEYYSENGMVASVESAMVPAAGTFISIKNKVWLVDSVAYALDHSDDPRQRAMRANVELIEPDLD